jgi:uncharacterized protein (DUF2345 family)
MTRDINWEARSYWKLGPNFGLDIKNPQLGLDGPDVYSFYATTDNGDQHTFGVTNGSGLFHIYNDKSIEIVAGQTNSGGGVDIQITSKNGDITITAEKNGNIRITGKNITLDADLDVNISAGRNVNINASKRFVVQTVQADVVAKTGNLAPQGTSTGEKIFGSESKAGIDIVQDTFFAGDTSKYIG